MGTEDTRLTCKVSHSGSAASAHASHAADGDAIVSPHETTSSGTDGGAAPGGGASETGLADSAVSPAAGNGTDAQVADPLLPLLAFTLQENLRLYKEVRISMDTDKTSSRYKSRSLREYDKFYCRLNQPTKWSQGTTLIDKDVCPFRLYEYHAIRDDPRFRDEQSRYNTKERKRQMRSRNVMIKAMLTKGNPVQFRNLGDYMPPLVHDKDCCRFEPVICLSHLQKGDIVFCQIGNPGQFHAGEIAALPAESAESAQAAKQDCGAWLKFQISTKRYKFAQVCNGCQIYGRLVAAVYKSG